MDRNDLRDVADKFQAPIPALRKLIEDPPSKNDQLSQPLAGLPLRRIVPMEMHAAMDYMGGLQNLCIGLCADSAMARAAGLALAGSVFGLSLLTDYRASLAKVVPIEVHEVMDYVWGASNVLAPFMFGYFRKSPVAASMQIMIGLMTIAGSLFTDYRAQKGVRWWGRSALPAT
jgi:hypothetical protein